MAEHSFDRSAGEYRCICGDTLCATNALKDLGQQDLVTWQYRVHERGTWVNASKWLYDHRGEYPNEWAWRELCVKSSGARAGTERVGDERTSVTASSLDPDMVLVPRAVAAYCEGVLAGCCDRLHMFRGTTPYKQCAEYQDTLRRVLAAAEKKEHGNG